MKKSYPNEKSKNMKLNLTSFVKTFVFIISLNLSYSVVYSQESNKNTTVAAALSNQKVQHIDVFRASISLNNSTNTNYTLQRFNSLINDKNPAVYITNNTINSYASDTNPTCLFTNISGLVNINNASIIKNDIELITIRINTISELSTILNLELLASYPKLRYIYFLSSFTVTRNNIRNMLQGTNQNYSVIYNIEPKY
jgi:hypothetical protein